MRKNSRNVKNAMKATSHIGGKAAVLSAGVVASLALGAAGTAFAAEAHAGGILAQGTAESLAKTMRAQADVQKRKAEVAKADRSKRAKLAAKRAAAARVSWVKPVAGSYKLSAGFNQSGGMWSHRHSGQDFAVNSGTKVLAVHSGTVVTAGWGGAYGNNIVIRHGHHTYSQYGHLSKIKVRVGQTVKTGQRIGFSGNTGNSSGPHLHFEIRTTPVYGSELSPLPFLRHQGVSV
ncbi:M23 family metallopeptidase [Streptomyces sp. NPDC059373]